jgi:DNA-binding MarR family transcriptional regulator
MSKIKLTINEQLQQLQMLMHRASFNNHFMGCGRAHSPHRGQGRVLAILKLKPEISQKELTYLLGMSKQAVAELIAKLEKSGCITREHSEEDKRVMKIRLTERGVTAAGNVDDASPEAAKFLDCLSDEELGIFSGYLDRIIERYEEEFPDDDFELRRRKMEDFMSFHGREFRHGHRPDCPSGGHGQRSGHGFEKHGHRSGHGFGGHGHAFADMEDLSYMDLEFGGERDEDGKQE